MSSKKLSKQLTTVQEDVHDLKTKCWKWRDENASLENQTNSIENYSHRDNLIIYGVLEPKDESASMYEKNC